MTQSLDTPAIAVDLPVFCKTGGESIPFPDLFFNGCRLPPAPECPDRAGGNAPACLLPFFLFSRTITVDPGRTCFDEAAAFPAHTICQFITRLT